MAELYKKEIPVVAPSFRVSRSATALDVYAGLGVRNVAVGVFDPSAVTGDRTIAAHGLGVYVPDNAVITKVWYDVVTTLTSATDAATVALHVQSAGDILAAIAISDATNVLDAGIRGTKIGFPNFGADTAHDSQVEVAALFAASYLKMTAEREITATVAVEALTAGKIVVFVEYIISA